MRILCTLLIVSLFAIPAIQAQKEYLTTPGLQMEVRDGYLYGSFDNEWIDFRWLERKPTSAFENLTLYLVRNDTGDTLQFSEFHFVFGSQPGSEFFQYESALLAPAQRLPLFKVKIKALENISWDNIFPRQGSAWTRNNKLSPGSYLAYFEWTHIHIPILGISNTIAFQIP